MYTHTHTHTHTYINVYIYLGFPDGSEGNESTCNAGETGSIPGSGRFPWRRECLPTPVFLPGEFQGQKEPSGLQSMELQRVRHNWVTNTHTHIYTCIITQPMHIYHICSKKKKASVFSLLLFFFASNIRFSYIEKKMMQEFFTCKNSSCSFLFPCKGTSLVTSVMISLHRIIITIMSIYGIC